MPCVNALSVLPRSGSRVRIPSPAPIFFKQISERVRRVPPPPEPQAGRRFRLPARIHAFVISGKPSLQNVSHFAQEGRGNTD
jgi:hypothetical protein